MYCFQKPYIYSFVIAGLIASPQAWSENDCFSQGCSQLQTQLELLSTQVKEANYNIKKLESSLTVARQDINVLQQVNTNKISSGSTITTEIQYKPNGRGIRKRLSH